MIEAGADALLRVTNDIGRFTAEIYVEKILTAALTSKGLR
jgi:hypothetical protein